MNTVTSLTAAEVEAALATILDPEFGISIVDLGLIYDVQTDADAVTVAMTLTTPSCPAGQVMVEAVHTVLTSIGAGRKVQVDLVWEPQWTPDMLSAAARDELGWKKTGDT